VVEQRPSALARQQVRRASAERRESSSEWRRGIGLDTEGKIIYGTQSDSRREFREMESDGANQRLLLGENAPQHFSQLAVSPGGDFIARFVRSGQFAGHLPCRFRAAGAD